ncbi:MAG: D-alanyl-D-alanine carboxypeptidase family protein [Actinomycetota bacterium]|nr:D-alanyl-D-alanine carboxypeptidase family protein [Actinomycetota bacterium]
MTGVLLGLLASGPAADAAESKDPRAERERVGSQRAELASELDALRASEAEVSAALADLDANVSDQRALLADAERVADQAAAHRDVARSEEAEAVAAVASLEEEARDVAVQEFMRPSGAEVEVLLSADSVTEGARRQALLSFRSRRADEVLDQLRAGREDLALRRQEAERAAVTADEKRAEVSGRLHSVEQAQARQQEFATSVEQRLDATLSEAAALESLDRRLAEQIAANEARIAAQLAKSRAAERPRGGAGPGLSRQVAATAGSIVSVRGIWVSSQIAGQLAALLDAADADGMAFGGGGYRDPSAQVALRRSNCGTSDYAVYSMSPSQCSPPTARPGASMHERGLAVDFTYNGSLISSRSNPGFQWLDANASRFGFYNLPAEPWHWSTNGQ